MKFLNEAFTKVYEEAVLNDCYIELRADKGIYALRTQDVVLLI